ncbi:hypothetical protein [Olleya namhaensis]|uniref:Lipoprotein n=1 Tax=Olleya namhaensis TaxID=1144750 RepID=A0A1I3M9J6_9FLAO|nr:hypothetical protein [Olleya namhaensis]SFI93661.1 hypothetical protein SAMN05443431_10366 [Olleya namhaensis]
MNTKALSLALSTVLFFLLLSSCGTKVVDSKKTFNSNSQTINKEYFQEYKEHLKNLEKGVLTEEALPIFKSYIKELFNIEINDTEYLTISYLKSRGDCWYDNYANINSKQAKINADKLKQQIVSDLVFAHYDNKKSTYSTKDEKKLLYSLFNKNYEVCDFTIVIDKAGRYYFKASHFNPEIANAMVFALKKEHAL